ncbi:hypothetical protein DAI22_10g091701 [Oryza sativa Japonica Group]|nr:hypothetical protein DAI22_10g091701 [Oryza sativa Japonica Group]
MIKKTRIPLLSASWIETRKKRRGGVAALMARWCSICWFWRRVAANPAAAAACGFELACAGGVDTARHGAAAAHTGMGESAVQLRGGKWPCSIAVVYFGSHNMEVTDNASPVARDPVRRRATCLRPLSLLPNGSLLIAYTCNGTTLSFLVEARFVAAETR